MRRPYTLDSRWFESVFMLSYFLFSLFIKFSSFVHLLLLFLNFLFIYFIYLFIYLFIYSISMQAGRIQLMLV